MPQGVRISAFFSRSCSTTGASADYCLLHVPGMKLLSHGLHVIASGKCIPLFLPWSCFLLRPVSWLILDWWHIFGTAPKSYKPDPWNNRSGRTYPFPPVSLALEDQCYVSDDFDLMMQSCVNIWLDDANCVKSYASRCLSSYVSMYFPLGFAHPGQNCLLMSFGINCAKRPESHTCLDASDSQCPALFFPVLHTQTNVVYWWFFTWTMPNFVKI